MPLAIGAQGVAQGLRGNPSNQYALPAGDTFLIPGGAWNLQLGPYLEAQMWDPQLGIWNRIGANGGFGAAGGGPQFYINSDGVNFRVANQTGCAVGALVTTAGSGYTNGIGSTATGLTVTASSGSSVWSPIIGGAVSTTVTITSGGTGFTYAPTLVVSAPPAGGIPATMTCTISSGVINAVTVTNQGAGYTSAPTITVVPDARDTITSNTAVLTAALTGSGTLTGLLCTNHGTALSSVPTLTFGSGAAAATVIMCWTITGTTIVTAGSGYTGAPIITGVGGFPTTAATLTNPATQRNLVRERPAWIRAGVTGVTITSTGQLIDDGGIYAGTPTALLLANAVPTLTTAAGITFTMGGVSDTFWLNPA